MGRHEGHPSRKRIATNNVLRAIWRAAVPCSRGTNKDPPSGPRLGAPDKARIDQRGAEGPDALQVLIKAPMAVSDYCLPREGRVPSHKPLEQKKKMGRHEGHPSRKRIATNNVLRAI